MGMNLVNPLLHVRQQMFYQQHQMALHHYQQDDISNANGWPTSAMLSSLSAGPQLPDDVKVELKNKKLWQQFHAETTEMIITKTGRRMFPSVQLSVSGLERRSLYCVLLELAPASNRRHKYVGGPEATARTGTRGWTSAGPAEPQPPQERRIYVHPESPATGAHWMQHSISFSKLKLTNNAVEQHKVLLTSMHKYIPKIWIIRCDDVANLRDFYNNPSSQFTFRETEFIAVTAYQNENITKLKIDNNPFAKGFRETGQSACKRKRQRLHLDDPTSSNSEISHDEEEGNVSSSDSDRNDLESPLAKRARESDESCSVSSSDTANDVLTPPPAAPLRLQAEAPRRETQPRLHRPWTDDTEEINPARTARTRSFENMLHASLNLPQQYRPEFLSMQPAAHYHLMALEFARMRQNYIAAAQQLPPLMDFRR